VLHHLAQLVGVGVAALDPDRRPLGTVVRPQIGRAVRQHTRAESQLVVMEKTPGEHAQHQVLHRLRSIALDDEALHAIDRAIDMR
jgi:hypothetical protein